MSAVRALLDMHRVESGTAGLAVNGVDREAEVFGGLQTLDDLHPEIALVLAELAVAVDFACYIINESDVENVTDYGAAFVLDSASVFDIDDIIEVAELILSLVDRQIASVVGIDDRS